MGRFGLMEITLILLIVLVLFGANKLPGIARSLGESVKEFKKSLAGRDKENRDGDKEGQEEKKES